MAVAMGLPQAIAASQVAPIETIEVVCHDLKLDTDFMGLFGMAYIFANNEDYNLTGAIYADSIPPGTYTNCVMDLKHIATQKMIPATSVTITLAVDANRNCIITGHMIGEDNIYYNLHLSWTPPTATDTVHIAFDKSSSVAYYPDLAHDFMLTNKDSGDYWSVIKGDGSLGKSFYATHDGEYFTSLYFLVDGTVEVSKKNGQLCMEMHALNSYDVPVHIVYDPTATTALSNSPSPITNSPKVLRHGQLLIEREGKIYNAQGIQIK